MRLFITIMKYICLSILIFNTLFFVYCIYEGRILTIITSIVNEFTLYIQTMIWNDFYGLESSDMLC